MIFVGQIVFDLWILTFFKIIEYIDRSITEISTILKNINVHKSKTI